MVNVGNMGMFNPSLYPFNTNQLNALGDMNGSGLNSSDRYASS